MKSGYTYYTQNAHGDVINLTDSTGAVTKSYTCDAFGIEQNIDDADTNAFRYCGEYYDKGIATIYLRARTIILLMDGLSQKLPLLAEIMIR